MAVLPGQKAPFDLDLGQVRNPNGTTNLDGRTLPRWQHTSASTDAPVPTFGALTDNTPLPAFPGHVLSGERAPTFFDDFYNRIYLLPASVDFKAIVSESRTSVVVWNAFLDTAVLTSIAEENGEGVSLTGPPTPYTFAPLATTSYDVVATSEGPATIDATYAFLFETAGTYELPVIGSRARLWPFEPNWRRPYRISYEFKTEVKESHSGKEQRRARRQQPRKTLAHMTTLKSAAELREYKALLASWHQRSWVIPERTRRAVAAVGMPAQGTFLTFAEAPWWAASGETVVLEYAGARELRTVSTANETEVHFSSTTDTSWPAGTYVCPGVPGYLASSLKAPRETNTVAEVSVEFHADPGVELPREPAAPVLTLRGRPVFLKRPNWAQTVSVTDEYPLSEVDYGVGRVARFDPVNFGTSRREGTYLNLDADQSVALLDHFLRMKGQWGEFYAPTWEPDLVPVQTLQQGAASIRVAGVEVYESYLGDTVHRALAILLRNGSVVVRGIDGLEVASDALGEDTVIGLETILTETIPLEEIVMVSWMPVWRFSSDGFTMEWLTNYVAQAKIAKQTLEDLPEETP